MIFFIFPLFFLSVSVSVSAASEDTGIECDLYNQRYPNLTITKVYGNKTTTKCPDICINYLCAVNVRDLNNNVPIYAMGSGCHKDFEKNCEISVGFRPFAQEFITYAFFADICGIRDGVKDCCGPLSKMINESIREHKDNVFGWGHRRDIEWKPEVDGVENWNETANTIHPITGAAPTTTTPLPVSATTTPAAAKSDNKMHSFFVVFYFSTFFIFSLLFY
uniref:Uncharacterized protein n=1 Tax=Panagrolaimus superbus TaxID=310955 RepID=A0A914XQW3_9BILA